MKKIDSSERNCCDGGKICPRMARKISAQENTIQVSFDCSSQLPESDFHVSSHCCLRTMRIVSIRGMSALFAWVGYRSHCWRRVGIDFARNASQLGWSKFDFSFRWLIGIDPLCCWFAENRIPSVRHVVVACRPAICFPTTVQCVRSKIFNDLVRTLHSAALTSSRRWPSTSIWSERVAFHRDTSAASRAFSIVHLRNTDASFKR